MQPHASPARWHMMACHARPSSIQRPAAAPPTAFAPGPAWLPAGTARGGRYGGHGNPAFADARDAPDAAGLAARAGSAALGLFCAS